MPALACLAEFRQAVADFPAEELEVAAEPAARAEAERSLAESGFLLLGEVHGVRENPLIIRSLLRAFGLTSLALEWPAELALLSKIIQVNGLLPDGTYYPGDYLLAVRVGDYLADADAPAFPGRSQAKAVRSLMTARAGRRGRLG